MSAKNSGPQLNSLRDNYNKLVSKKAIAVRVKEYNGNLIEDLQVFKKDLKKIWNYGKVFVY